MPHPNKPQLAFAWIGAPQLLSQLWSAMTQTRSLGEKPRELLHRPQIIAVEAEAWCYRFSCCAALRDLLYMRVNARKHSGVIWCHEAHTKPTPDEHKMLCYAGASRLPAALLLRGLREGSDAAAQEESRLRLLLEDLGFQADEAIFVVSPPEEPAEEAILRLYQRLDQSSPRLEEQRLPPELLRRDEAEFLFMLPGDHTLTETSLRAPYLGNPRQPRLTTRRHQWLQLYRADDLSVLRLRLTFEATASLRPEEILSGGLYHEQRQIVASECVILV